MASPAKQPIEEKPTAAKLFTETRKLVAKPTEKTLSQSEPNKQPTNKKPAANEGSYQFATPWYEG